MSPACPWLHPPVLDVVGRLPGEEAQAPHTWNALYRRLGKENSPGMIHTPLNGNGNGNVALKATCR
jgi:hypothetical protein